MFIATSLSHYKRPEIREAIVSYADQKEVGVIFDKTKFGKRPDILSYEQDVLDLAKRKASSFHCSEELWENPLMIRTGMKRSELDEIRSGWDLILDVDCPHWEFSKLITHLFVRALEDHGVRSITVKFSGNKGFHIGVPFEAFPEQVFFNGEMHPTKKLFPEVPRKIALYLLSYITSHFISIREKEVVFLEEFVFPIPDLEAIAQQSGKTLFAHRCVDCGAEYRARKERSHGYTCSSCGFESHPKGVPEFIRCERCHAPVSVQVASTACAECASTRSPEQFLNLLAIVEIDTVLLASRHLYRMPYSLHEKSGLVSVPISLNDILSFDKASAKPDTVGFEHRFLLRSSAKPDETAELLQEALSKELSELGHIHADLKPKPKLQKEVGLPDRAFGEETFPPCMQYINSPLEDGKKRALFILVNFLQVSGWALEDIEEYITKWNNAHPDPLREVELKSQLQKIKRGKKPIPPPNCDNRDYYIALGFCHPDGLCKRIKNPAMYAKRKFEMQQKKKPKTKKKPSKKKN